MIERKHVMMETGAVLHVFKLMLLHTLKHLNLIKKFVRKMQGKMQYIIMRHNVTIAT